MIAEYTIKILLIITSTFIFLRLLYHTSISHISQKWISSFLDTFHLYCTYKIPKYNDQFQENQLHRKVSAYISMLPSLKDSNAVTLFSANNLSDVTMALDSGHSVHDTFLGARLTWRYQNGYQQQINPDKMQEPDAFVLKMRRMDKNRILRSYIQHIYKVADELEQKKKELRIYINCTTKGYDPNTQWRSFTFVHPASFDTLVLDNDLKNKVKNDLDQYLKSEQYYNKLGRSWKRSYLLYGVPGTGKSSFAAAMAKFLNYSVYDIDLSRVSNGSDLKLLLLQTSRRSLILIENFDFYLKGNSSTAENLPGILNFMDGVLSSCGEERVMVFTMTSKDPIDPAVLRPGRVDVHIHFPLCDYTAFKALANSHLGLKDHRLFGQVEDLFQTGCSLSPAEISEIMISNRNSPSRALKSVIMTLQNNNDTRELNKVAERASENTTGRSRTQSLDESDESGSGYRRESARAMKEIRKFYDLLKRSGSKKELGEMALDDKDR